MSLVTAGRPGQERVLSAKQRQGQNLFPCLQLLLCWASGSKSFLDHLGGPCPVPQHPALPNAQVQLCPALPEELFNQKMLFNQTTRGDRLVVTGQIWHWLPSMLSSAALHRPGNVLPTPGMTLLPMCCFQL